MWAVGQVFGLFCIMVPMIYMLLLILRAATTDENKKTKEEARSSNPMYGDTAPEKSSNDAHVVRATRTTAVCSVWRTAAELYCGVAATCRWCGQGMMRVADQAGRNKRSECMDGRGCIVCVVGQFSASPEEPCDQCAAPIGLQFVQLDRTLPGSILSIAAPCIFSLCERSVAINVTCWYHMPLHCTHSPL